MRAPPLNPSIPVLPFGSLDPLDPKGEDNIDLSEKLGEFTKESAGGKSPGRVSLYPPSPPAPSICRRVSGSFIPVGPPVGCVSG